MFRPSAALIFLAVSLRIVNAVPAPPEPSQNVPNVAGHITPGLDAYKSGQKDGLVALAARPGVFLCVNAQFVEPCQYIMHVVPGACYSLTSPVIFANSLSSLGRDRGLMCYGYLNGNCTPAHPNLGPIYYPGIAIPVQFVEDGINFHDHINGIICWNS